MSSSTPLPPLRTSAHVSKPTESFLPRLPSAVSRFAEDVQRLQLVDASGLREFFARAGSRVAELQTPDKLGQALVSANLLTAYQLDRILAGQTYGLCLGNYRVLERIGGGTVGVVFLGEHVMLRRRVAIKVIQSDQSFAPEVLERFHSEMRVLASLHHPHIVLAYDGGVLTSPDSTQPPLHYLVMEHVAGGDLEQYVYARNAPLDVDQACEWIRQAATGLQEAHDHHLIHRDLKPSNLLLTAKNKIKLVDFGLAKQFSSGLTEQGSLLGSLEFMAPEQSLDPGRVGGPADIYGLGATLFWLLTGQLPFPAATSLAEMLRTLQTGRPRRMREFGSDIPAELDELVNRMLARNPEHRPESPVVVMNALTKFAAPAMRTSDSASTESDPRRVAQLLLASNHQLEESLQARDNDVRRTQDALLFAMAKMAESREGETAGHLVRLQKYSLALAGILRDVPSWSGVIDKAFLELLKRCIPLHDIGKIGVPDDILSKPASLSAGERILIEQHSLIGDALLEAIGREYGESFAFLGMARAIVRHHHERHDGRGYPDRLAGEAIPHAARILALADVYDAVRRRRAHKPAVSHINAVTLITEQSPGQFDPAVVLAFLASADQFERIYQSIAN